MQNNLDFINTLIEKAKKLGAEDAEAIFVENNSISASVRLGNIEDMERSESKGYGLRVVIGKKSAIVSSTDTSESTINTLVERAVNMAQMSPEDKYLTLVSSEQIARNIPELDLYDSNEPSPEWLIEQSKKMEDVALSYKGISNSSGSGASYSTNTIALVTSRGFSNVYQTSSAGMSVSVVAHSNNSMETDYDYSSARFISDLKTPEEIGKTTAERTLKKLNPKKIETSELPVIFDPRVARSLLSSFASSINGAAIARGTSFLKNKMNEPIFNSDINIIDDPFIKRGLNSRPFDGEAVQAKKLFLVENGILKTWLLDLRSAAQLGLQTTGNAIRGMSSPPIPAPSNLYLTNGKASKEDLIKDIKKGVYITDLFGMGINLITGDYSQGAAGFLIENGEITYPVSEITIASNLTDMFKNLIPANDLEFKYGINSPTILITKMTIAGK
jgi:PmbA protein